MEKFLDKFGSESILIGKRGAGKSTFIRSLISEISIEMLDKWIEKNDFTNLNMEKKFVFTDNKEFDDKIRIAIKKKKYIFNIENLYKATLNSIERLTKYTKLENDKQAFNLFVSYMKENCLKYDESFNMIDREIFDEYVYNLCKFFKGLVSVDRVISRSIAIKNKYKNSGKLIDKDAILGSMRLYIQEEIQNLNLVKQTSFKNIISKFNYELSKAFYKYFSKDKISSDGYHYIDIKQKINFDVEQIQSSNINDLYVDGENISKDKNLNNNIKILSSLTDEMIIYVSVHEKIAQMIRDNNKSKYLQNEKGDIYFSILDTKAVLSGEKSEEYIKNIIYNKSYDSIIFMKSIMEKDSEFDIVIEEAIEGINREIPIFIVNSKVDLLISQCKKEYWNKTKISCLNQFEQLDSMEDDIYISKNRFDYSIATEFIDRKILCQQKLYNELQRGKKYKRDIYVLACMEFLDYESPVFVQKKYYIVGAIYEIFRTLIKKYENNRRILFNYNSENNSFSGMKVEFSKEVIRDIVNTEFKSEKGLVRIKNIIDNINFNYGVNPNEVSYEIAREKLSYGDKYMSCIKRDFGNYEPFDWTFPIKFREELINEFFIKDIIKNAISIKNCEFDEGGYKKFFKEIEVYKMDIARKLSISIIHDVILLESEYENMFNTYKTRYNEYLFKLKTSIYNERIKLILEKNIESILQEFINTVIIRKTSFKKN